MQTIHAPEWARIIPSAFTLFVAGPMIYRMRSEIRPALKRCRKTLETEGLPLKEVFKAVFGVFALNLALSPIYYIFVGLIFIWEVWRCF